MSSTVSEIVRNEERIVRILQLAVRPFQDSCVSQATRCQTISG